MFDLPSPCPDDLESDLSKKGLLSSVIGSSKGFVESEVSASRTDSLY